MPVVDSIRRSDVSPSYDVDAAMARLADGDPAAFDAVYEARWPLLFTYCKKLLRERRKS